MVDVVIVGGGPAGLSAALVLGRCRRSVLVVDAGEPRNARARALHGYLTRDGTPPLELLRLGRAELAQYDVELHAGRVVGVDAVAEGFVVALDSGRRVETRMVLIASGVRDRLPDIPGIAECYGLTVHHCPYCDGWEHRDRILGVLGHGAGATALALSLRTWSDRVIVCTNNGPRLGRRHRQQLLAHAVDLHEERIERVEHDDGELRAIVLAGGTRVACEAIFFTGGQAPQSDLPHQLGCEIAKHGVVKTDHLGRTCVPGVYVAGDASRDVQFVVVAAAEGAKAAVAMNRALQARAGQVAAS